jgi:hypothetical protein
MDTQEEALSWQEEALRTQPRRAVHRSSRHGKQQGFENTKSPQQKLLDKLNYSSYSVIGPRTRQRAVITSASMPMNDGIADSNRLYGNEHARSPDIKKHSHSLAVSKVDANDAQLSMNDFYILRRKQKEQNREQLEEQGLRAQGKSPPIGRMKKSRKACATDKEGAAYSDALQRIRTADQLRGHLFSKNMEQWYGQKDSKRSQLKIVVNNKTQQAALGAESSFQKLGRQQQQQTEGTEENSEDKASLMQVAKVTMAAVMLQRKFRSWR